MSDGRVGVRRMTARPIEARPPPRPSSSLSARILDRVRAGADTHEALRATLPGVDDDVIRRAVALLVHEELLHQDGRRIGLPVPVPVPHPEEEEREMPRPRPPERTTAPRAANGGAGCSDAPRAAQVARYVHEHPEGVSRATVATALGLGASNAGKALGAAVSRGWARRTGSGVGVRFLPGDPPPGAAAQPASGEASMEPLARGSAPGPGPGDRQPEPEGAGPSPAPPPPARPSPAPAPPVAPAPAVTSVEVAGAPPEAGALAWVPPPPSAVTSVLAQLRMREEELERELDDVQTAMRVLQSLGVT